MWRSVFLAIGISLCILGVECLFVEKAVLANGEKAPAAAKISGLFSRPEVSARREVKTKEWMPWSFMSSGAVIILYTLTLKKRAEG